MNVSAVFFWVMNILVPIYIPEIESARCSTSIFEKQIMLLAMLLDALHSLKIGSVVLFFCHNY